MTLSEITKLTEDFAAARNRLSEQVQNLEEELALAKKRHIGAIKRAVAYASEKQANLTAALAEAPELFEKPRTIVICGIKVGYQKQKGTLEWEDDSAVVKMLKKHFPETWETYVKVIEKPLKSALETLSVNDLKKLGITAEDTGDQIVIKSMDSEVDRLVAALLKESEEIKDAA